MLLYGKVWVLLPIVFFPSIIVHTLSYTSLLLGVRNDPLTLYQDSETFCKTLKESIKYWVVEMRVHMCGFFTFAGRYVLEHGRHMSF